MIAKKILAERLVENILISLLAVMTAVTAYQVFGRYVLEKTPYWSEQAVLLMLNYLVYLGVPLLFKYGQHIGFDYFCLKLNGKTQFYLYLFRQLLLAAFALLMLYYSSSLMYEVRTHTIMTLSISKAYSYIPITLSGAAVALICLNNLKEALWKS